MYILTCYCSVQVTGIPLAGLESEHAPLLDALLPRVLANARDPQDPVLRLLCECVAKLPLSVLSLLQVKFSLEFVESKSNSQTTRMKSIAHSTLIRCCRWCLQTH